MAHDPDVHADPIPLHPLPDVSHRLEFVSSSPLGIVPRPLTSLIGRETETAAALALLTGGETRLLTLIGPGGVGKTRLALRIADDAASIFPDGVVFVSLATLTDPALVLPAIAWELGARDLRDRPAAELVAGMLREREFALVLDNFEQVRLAATAVATLLAACPRLAILVTSRVPLRVAGEQRFLVAPLALPGGGGHPTVSLPLEAVAASPAVQLFVARARAVDRGFALDLDNAGAVAAICRRLDGLPLAIELAAARMRLLSPTELLRQLRPALPLLTGGPDDAPARLQTMRSAIAWSYNLLSPPEQVQFRHLAIFAGGFTPQAAEAVADLGSHASTLDRLASLLDAGLLRRTETSGGTRFEMLETIREFGLERLAESGETETAADRHVDWCLEFAESVRRSGRLSQSGGLLELEIEHPNQRAALDWLLERGSVTRAMHLAGQLAEFWLRHGHVEEGQAWLERALAADGDGPTAARAEALVGLSMLQWPRPDYSRANDLLAEAEAVARAAGDAGALAYARLHQGYVAVFSGDLDLAQARGEESLTTCAAIPQGHSIHGPRWLLARAAREQGNDAQAAEQFAALLASGRATGDDVSVANGLQGLAYLAESRGELRQALAGFAAAAAVCERFGDRLHASMCLTGVARCVAAIGQSEGTVRLLAAAESLRHAVGAPVSPEDRLSVERTLTALRAELGAECFAAAWTAGAALSLDEAIATAEDMFGSGMSAAPAQPADVERLTERERDVLHLLVRGWSDKEIAATLGIGRRTVSSHVAAIRAKLDAPSRSAAAAIAVRDRLV